MTTLAAVRLRALGRAELTLLLRNRAALFTALLLPIGMTLAVRSGVQGMDLSGTGLTVGTVLLPGAIGFVLLFGVYVNLVSTYVVRREELVLKRLRTGEAGDTEILLGAALPAIVIAVTQCALLLAGGALLLDLSAPEQAGLLVLGLLLGLALMVAAAAATAIVTKGTEAAQLTPMPLMMLSFGLSGVFVPLDIMADRLADFAAWLPMTPVMELVRGGWTGELSAAEALRATALAASWVGIALWAVRRRFRWEPRH